MNMRQPSTNRPAVRKRAKTRFGISMLEVVIAGSMLAGVMGSLSVVMRTARQSWTINDDEAESLHQLHTVVRHFVRAAREARKVVVIQPNGSAITLEMRDGSTHTWAWKNAHQGMSKVVTAKSSLSGSENVAAQNIRTFQFVGFDADGITTTALPDDIRLIAVTAVSDLDGTAAQRQVHSKVWLRSW